MHEFREHPWPLRSEQAHHVGEHAEPDRGGAHGDVLPEGDCLVSKVYCHTCSLLLGLNDGSALINGSRAIGHSSGYRYFCGDCWAGERYIEPPSNDLPRPRRRSGPILPELDLLYQQTLRGRGAAGRRLLRLACAAELPRLAREKFEVFCEVRNMAEVARRLGFGQSTIHSAVQRCLRRVSDHLQLAGAGYPPKAVVEWLMKDLDPLIRVTEDKLDEQGAFDSLRALQKRFAQNQNADEAASDTEDQLCAGRPFWASGSSDTVRRDLDAPASPVERDAGLELV